MTADPGWKKLERRVAVYLGGTRNPLSGGAGRHTRGDALLPFPIYIEAKHGKQAATILRSRRRLVRLFLDTWGKAAAEGKIPLLVLHPPRFPGGVGNYPAFITSEAMRPVAAIGRTTPALILPADTIIQVPLLEVKKSLDRIEGPFP